MNMKRSILTMLALVLAGVVTAQVYRWVDESGRVHFGDRPPDAKEARPVAVTPGPSKEEVEQAQQRLRRTLERQQTSDKKEERLDPEEKVSDVPAIIPDNVKCHAPLSDFIDGPSGDTHTPISATLVSKAQRQSLIRLFSEIDGYWQGTITHVGCKGKTSDPKSWITKGKVRTNADWNARKSRLSIESDYTGESGAVDRIFHNIEVGSVLYFTEHPTRSIDRKHNEVEVLASNQKELLFLTKQWQAKLGGGALPRAHIRYLEISGRKLKLRELLFHMGMLVDSSTWVLGK